MSLQTRDQVPRHMATTARMSVNYSIMPHCSWVPSHSILDKLDAEIEKEEFGVDISDQYSVNRYVFSVPQSDDNLDDEIEEEEKEEFGVDIYDSLDQEIEEEEFGVDISEYLETSTYYGPMCDDEEKDACYICAYEYEVEDIIGTLHCGHDFHADCVKKWLLTRKKTCPCCSNPVLPIHDSLDKEIEEEEFGVEIYDSLDIEEEEFEVEISEYLETRTYYGPMCNDEEKDACYICAYEYEVEDIIGTLYCGHDFHADCAKKWLLTRNKTCPCCSDPVLPIHDSLDKQIEEEEFGVEIYDSLDKEIEEEEFEVEISEYLETRTYYGPMFDDEEKDACFICAYEYEDEDIIGTLHCGHDFHADCAKKWLLTRKKACPVCSDAVLPIQC